VYLYLLAIKSCIKILIYKALFVSTFFHLIHPCDHTVFCIGDIHLIGGPMGLSSLTGNQDAELCRLGACPQGYLSASCWRLPHAPCSSCIQLPEARLAISSQTPVDKLQKHFFKNKHVSYFFYNYSSEFGNHHHSWKGTTVAQ